MSYFSDSSHGEFSELCNILLLPIKTSNSVSPKRISLTLFYSSNNFITRPWSNLHDIVTGSRNTSNSPITGMEALSNVRLLINILKPILSVTQWITNIWFYFVCTKQSSTSVVPHCEFQPFSQPRNSPRRRDDRRKYSPRGFNNGSLCRQLRKGFSNPLAHVRTSVNGSRRRIVNKPELVMRDST